MRGALVIVIVVVVFVVIVLVVVVVVKSLFLMFEHCRANPRSVNAIPLLLVLLLGSGAGLLLTIGCENLVEDLKEEKEVGEVHDNARLEADVRGGTGHTGILVFVDLDADPDTKYHLKELEERDSVPRDEAGPHAHRRQRVIKVHDAVHRVVHRNEVDAGARLSRVRLPDVKQHGEVVVPVEQHERLLPEHDEDRIDQLRDLTDDEEK